jgi:hypothetical protein
LAINDSPAFIADHADHGDTAWRGRKNAIEKCVLLLQANGSALLIGDIAIADEDLVFRNPDGGSFEPEVETLAFVIVLKFYRLAGFYHLCVAIEEFCPFQTWIEL